jgi:hypothetical protein
MNPLEIFDVVKEAAFAIGAMVIAGAAVSRLRT